MPRASNVTRAILPVATISAVQAIRARRRELEGPTADLSAENTARINGLYNGLIEAEAMILEAACDTADNPSSPL